MFGMLSRVEPTHLPSVHCFATGKANVRFTDDNIQLEPLAVKLRLHERFVKSNASQGKKMKTGQARSGSSILRLADRFMEQVPVEARSNHRIQRGSDCEVAGWPMVASFLHYLAALFLHYILGIFKILPVSSSVQCL